MGLKFWGIITGGLCTLASASVFAAAQVDQDLQAELFAPGGELTVVVHFAGQYDLSKVPQNLTTSETIDFLTSALKKYNQSGLKLLGNFLRKYNDVKEFRPIWITNSARITAPKSVIQDLVALNGIERLSLNAEKQIDELETPNASLFIDPLEIPQESELSWGVAKVGAPDVWNVQINGTPVDGRGIKVAVVDTGINFKHPDLMNRIAYNAGEMGTTTSGEDRSTNGKDDDGNGFIDDYRGWNFQENDNDPRDRGGHGSKATGIVVGDGTNGIQTGVAPGASVVPIRACCGNNSTFVFESNVWLALEYAMLSKVRVISMSLSVKYYANPSLSKWRRIGEVLLKAGIVHVNSAGNQGNRKLLLNVGAPASNPPAWLHKEQKERGGLSSMIAVGATDEQDQIRKYSSRGPVSWQGVRQYRDYVYQDKKRLGLIKPEVCGPSEIPSTSQFGAGYTKSFGGTSSATPAVAGVAALLLSARPDLNVAQVTETLMMSAVSSSGTLDNDCGAGRVDIVNALAYANKHFPSP